MARSKLSSIEIRVSKVLINNGISLEDFETIIDEEKKIPRIKIKYY